MAFQGTDRDTISWLTNQLLELDRWRADLLHEPDNRIREQVELIDSHRLWLESALTNLGGGQLLTI
ncbi:MAG: hypothetical protein AAGK23_03345 [Pseudomonadota bacterium]